MARVLVTGGAGFIGSHLVEELVRRGHDVRIMDDWSCGTRENLLPLMNGDSEWVPVIAASPYISAIAEWIGEGAVFHLASKANLSWSRDHRFKEFDHDLCLTKRLLKFAVEMKAERFIFVSSSAVYAQADCQEEDVTPLAARSPYEAAKLAGEALVSMAAGSLGLPGLSVRPFNIYGPRQRIRGGDKPVVPRFLRAAIKGEPIVIQGTGEQGLDFVYVKDAARWLAGLMDVDVALLDGRPVNLGLGVTLSMNRLAALCMNATGHTVEVEHRASISSFVRETRASIKRMQAFGEVPGTHMVSGLYDAARYYCGAAAEGGDLV